MDYEVTNNVTIINHKFLHDIVETKGVLVELESASQDELQQRLKL